LGKIKDVIHNPVEEKVGECLFLDAGSFDQLIFLIISHTYIFNSYLFAIERKKNVS